MLQQLAGDASAAAYVRYQAANAILEHTSRRPRPAPIESDPPPPAAWSEPPRPPPPPPAAPDDPAWRWSTPQHRGVEAVHPPSGRSADRRAPDFDAIAAAITAREAAAAAPPPPPAKPAT